MFRTLAPCLVPLTFEARREIVQEFTRGEAAGDVQVRQVEDDALGSRGEGGGVRQLEMSRCIRWRMVPCGDTCIGGAYRQTL